MNTTDITTTRIDQIRHVTAAVTALVKHATPDQLLHDSPCTGWSGRDVLNHMVGGADWFAGPARGEEVPFPNWSAMPDWLGADPVRSYRVAVDRAIEAYAAPGVLDSNIVMPWGEMPAMMALNLLNLRPGDSRLGPRADHRHPDEHPRSGHRGGARDLDRRRDPEPSATPASTAPNPPRPHGRPGRL